MSDDDKKLSTGRLARFAKLASLSAKLSTDVVTRGVRRFTGGGGAPDLSSMLGAGAAEKLVATLGDLKGLAMKLGQQVSMDPDLLTPEVRAVIARLQNQAPPMPWVTVRKVLREGLGREPEEAFERVEEVPLASASLGQVHRAWTKGGDEVVVKVQYPDIAQALKSDLDNLGSMVSVVTGTARLAHGRNYYAELRETLMEELDYRLEAVRSRAFAQAAAPLTDVKVPRVYDELTSEKVLTLELLHGRTVKDVFNHMQETTPEQRFAASRQLIRAIWGPFFLTGLIHADPHPGNFMLLDDGRIGVLDYGAVKQISDQWTQVNRRMYRAVIAGQPFDPLAMAQESGFTFEDLEMARPFVDTVIDIANRPLRTSDFDFKSAFINRDMRNLFIKFAPKLPSMRPPKESVQFFRAVGGLSQNLENLGARGDFRAVWRELLELSPA